MTANSESSVAVAQIPSGILLRRADLGGWVLEIITSDQRVTGAYSTSKALIEELTHIMNGTSPAKGKRGRKPKLAAGGEDGDAPSARKKPGPKKGWKKEKAVETEVQPVAQAA